MPDIRDKMLTNRYGPPTLNEAMARIRRLEGEVAALLLDPQPKKAKKRKKGWLRLTSSGWQKPLPDVPEVDETPNS